MHAYVAGACADDTQRVRYSEKSEEEDPISRYAMMTLSKMSSSVITRGSKTEARDDTRCRLTYLPIRRLPFAAAPSTSPPPSVPNSVASNRHPR